MTDVLKAPGIFTIHDLPGAIEWAAINHENEGSYVATARELDAIATEVNASQDPEVMGTYRLWVGKRWTSMNWVEGREPAGNVCVDTETRHYFSNDSSRTASAEPWDVYTDFAYKIFEAPWTHKVCMPLLRIDRRQGITVPLDREIGQRNFTSAADYSPFIKSLKANITSIETTRGVLQGVWPTARGIEPSKTGNDDVWQDVARLGWHPMPWNDRTAVLKRIIPKDDFVRLAYLYRVVKIIVESEEISPETKRDYLAILARSTKAGDKDLDKIANDMIRDAYDSCNTAMEAITFDFRVEDSSSLFNSPILPTHQMVWEESKEAWVRAETRVEELFRHEKFGRREDIYERHYWIGLMVLPVIIAERIAYGAASSKLLGGVYAGGLGLALSIGGRYFYNGWDWSGETPTLEREKPELFTQEQGDVSDGN